MRERSSLGRTSVRSSRLGFGHRRASSGMCSGRGLLMAAEGLSTRAIARDLGTMPRTVSHWRIRFAEEGLSGLDDRPRPGGRASAKYDETTDRRILAVLGRPPPEGYARWTGGLVAEALGDVSDQYVWRFLRAQKIGLDGKSWCESTASWYYFPAGRYVLFSDIPNNRIIRFFEDDGHAYSRV